MANVLYPKFKQALLSGAVDLTSVNVKAVLVDAADYTYASTHEFLSDVPSGARVATSANLGSKTVTDGVFDSADTTFTTVTGDPSEAVILYVDTGTAATSRLICYIDTATGLPVTPSGADIPLAWNNGANKIFAL